MVLSRKVLNMSLTPQADPEDEWDSHEQLFTFGQLARRIGVNPSTIWRWTTRGCLSKKGRCVKLQARRMGSRNKTSLQRYRKFTKCLNDDEEEGPAPGAALRLPITPPKSPDKSRIDEEKQTKEAMAILQLRGVID